MVLVTYDIADDKLRTSFSKFLSRFGERIQYSVFKIENSERILNNITIEIEANYQKRFDEQDSVYIFKINENNVIKRYGYAKHDTDEIMVVG